MSRDDLSGINYGIIEKVGFSSKATAPNAFVIVITNIRCYGLCMQKSD